MKCRHFLSFVSLVLSACFFGSFITTQNSFALEDLSVTIDSTSSISRGDLIFPACDSSCFDQYSYLIFEPLSYDLASSSSLRFSFYVTGYGYKTFDVSTLSTTFVSLVSFFDNVYFYNPVPNNFSFKITLTDSLPSPGCPEPPSGDLSITSNGTYDVTSYASATVNVPAEVIQGDYHDDLVNIQNSIIICGAILLVLYFFYCIYRLIIKNSGVH